MLVHPMSNCTGLRAHVFHGHCYSLIYSRLKPFLYPLHTHFLSALGLLKLTSQLKSFSKPATHNRRTYLTVHCCVVTMAVVVDSTADKKIICCYTPKKWTRVIGWLQIVCLTELFMEKYFLEAIMSSESISYCHRLGAWWQLLLES